MGEIRDDKTGKLVAVDALPRPTERGSDLSGALFGAIAIFVGAAIFFAVVTTLIEKQEEVNRGLTRIPTWDSR